jgi:hypothetical protein
MQTLHGLTKLVCFGVVLPAGALVLGISVDFFQFLGGGPSVAVAGILLGSIVCCGVLTLISGAMQFRGTHGRARMRLVALVIVGMSPLIFTELQDLWEKHCVLCRFWFG